MKKLKMVFLIIVCVGIASFFHNVVSARVDGPCSICHTMHNSQDEKSMIYDNDPSEEPFPHLLRGSCIGCHTGYNKSGNDIPYVYAALEPVYPEHVLAGGSFWWVAKDGGADDCKGHNVYGLSDRDGNLTKAPGKWIGCSTDNSCHVTLAEKQTSIPSFGSGCGGCHLAPAHHADDSDTVVGEAGGWFRYCSGHEVGQGVIGIEAPGWDLHPSPETHNEYLGKEARLDRKQGFADIGNTMTAFCCGCHGGFHKENDSGTWIRHPSDGIIPVSGEYEDFSSYDPRVPIARPSLDGWTGPDVQVYRGKDMVMCLSCHRAHGSPFPDILRWNYDLQVAGGGIEKDYGCFKCHSEKD